MNKRHVSKTPTVRPETCIGINDWREIAQSRDIIEINVRISPKQETFVVYAGSIVLRDSTIIAFDWKASNVCSLQPDSYVLEPDRIGCSETGSFRADFVWFPCESLLKNQLIQPTTVNEQT